MDKSTLSNYGWVVIAVLVLSVMIALATPFGTYISNAVKSTTEGLFQVEQKALGAAGLVVDDQKFENAQNSLYRAYTASFDDDADGDLETMTLVLYSDGRLVIYVDGVIVDEGLYQINNSTIMVKEDGTYVATEFSISNDESNVTVFDVVLELDTDFVPIE